MKKMILQVLVLWMFIVYGCSSNPVAKIGMIINTGGDLYFPLRVGNYWKYNKGDTVSITGTQVVSGKTVYITNTNELFYNDSLGTWYYGHTASPLATPSLQFKYPLVIGASWNYAGWIRKVSQISDVTLPNGIKYTDCYRIDTYYNSDGTGSFTTNWIKENVGIVATVYDFTFDDYLTEVVLY